MANGESTPTSPPARDAVNGELATLSALISRCPFGIYIVDASFRIAMMNDASQRGAFRNIRPVIGTRLDDAMRTLWPEPVAGEVIARFRRTLETGEPYASNEFYNRRADADAVEGYEWALHRVTLPDGSAGVICYYFDSTPLRSTEVALRRSEQRYRAVLESLSEMVCRFRPDGTILFVNEAYARAIGTTVAAIEGGNFWNFIPPEDHAPVRAMLDTLSPDNPQVVIENRMGLTGQVRWTRWTNRALTFTPEGKVDEAQATGVDVTARREAEQALRRSEERLRLAQLGGGVGVWDWQAATGETWWSDSMWALYGASPLPSEQIRAFWEDRIHPGDRPRVTARIAACLASGDREFRDECRIVRGDGAERWVQIAAQVERDAAGAPLRMYGTNVDITDRKRSEESLREAKEAAEAANVVKDNFLATLSHELRTPLTPALAAVSAWAGDSSVQPPELRDDLALVRRNLALETRLIDDLLDLTRIVRGKLLLNFESVHVGELVDSVVSMYRVEAREKRVELWVRAEAEPSHTRGDAGRLQQVFWNLLKNALKFTPAGGRVSVSTRDAAGRVEVEVADTGIGMTPEVLARLFRPFEQGSAESVRRYGGLGLGLAISKALVEAHGGTIAARSDGPGTGSAFVVSLPVVAPDAAARPAPAGEGGDEPAGPPLRVMLVEDHADTVFLMQKLLTARGHDVRVAQTVADAIRTIAAAEFDLIVSDIGLPDGTGLDLIRHVRGELKRNTPAVAVTGYGMEEDVARAREAGFDVHVTKPVNLIQLERVMRDLARPG